MSWITTMQWVRLAAGVLGIILFAPLALAKSRPVHPYRYSVVDVPVSLAAGSVRTPEFSPRKTSWYWIIIQAQRSLPFQQMMCMMGVTHGPLESKNCTCEDPLLGADWIVWSDGQIVSKGSTTTKADSAFTDENIFKFLGKFPALAGQKYLLEVKFTRDGSPLDVANPHLIVTRIGDE